MAIKKNMGVLDRATRILASGLLIYFSLVDTSFVDNQIVLYIMATFGIVNLVTALVAYCPLYAVAHLSTISDKSS